MGLIRITQQEAEADAIKIGLILLETYLGCMVKIKYKCIKYGHESLKRPETVRRGKGCMGCKRDRLVARGLKKEKGLQGLNRVLDSYKQHAKQRNLSFNLTRDNFRDLTLNNNCFYCNVRLDTCTGQLTAPRKSLKSHSSQEYRNHNSFGPHFGIDRIDNCAGYEINNCVTCCSLCNYSKRDLPITEWMKYISRFNTERLLEIKLKIEELCIR